MSASLEEYLKSFALLTEAEIALVVQAGYTKELKKGDYFIKEGQVCEHVAFVNAGFFRSFYYAGNGEEITYCFTFAGSFVTAYSSYIAQSGTRETICALADSEIFVIPRAVLLQLEASSMNWLRLTKRLAEQEYLKMENVVFVLQKSSAETKYRHLLATHPEYLQLISLAQLASYLGITQRHLSRIRRHIMN